MERALKTFKHKFKPTFHTIDTVGALPLESQLSKETSMYQASMDFAYDKGGRITMDFVDKLPFGFDENVIVDVRVHRLERGYYPAIPGYHLDWLPRVNKGQDPFVETIPDYDHVVLIVAETSLTEFLNQQIELELPEQQAFEYANQTIKEGQYRTKHVNSGDMVQFTSRDWHRPTPAQGDEWRLLIRASRIDHKRPTNRIVTQSQVYIPIREASW